MNAPDALRAAAAGLREGLDAKALAVDLTITEHHPHVRQLILNGYRGGLEDAAALLDATAEAIEDGLLG